MASWKYPGGPQKQQEGYLEDRKQFFNDFNINFRDSISEDAWVPRANILVFVRAGFQDTFCTDLESKSGGLGVSEPGFLFESIAKRNFSSKSFCKDIRVDFCCFLKALGQFFCDCCALGDRLEN